MVPSRCRAGSSACCRHAHLDLDAVQHLDERAATVTSTTEPPPDTSTTDSADTSDTADTTADTTGNTTDVVDCTDLGPNQCAAQPGCQEVLGQKINAQKMCLQKPSFLACIAADGCDDAPTLACPMGTNQQYQFPDTCIPPDFEVCDGMTLDMNYV